MLTVHVDDILIAHDDSSASRALVQRLMVKYPFGDLQRARDGPVTYTGKTLEVVTGEGGEEVHVHQKSFIRGRLEVMALQRDGRTPEQEVTRPEASEFKRMCGSLCWLSGLTRPDVSEEVNMLQKRQGAPRIKDCKRAIALIEQIKKTEDVALKIKPLQGRMSVVCYTDSALYNSYSEEGITDDAALSQAERQLVRSQHGAMVVIASEEEMNSTEGIRASPVDWFSRASRRIVRSTFAAETGAALEAYGRGAYVQAMLSELQAGAVKKPHEWRESVVKLYLVTDCKSLYDNMLKECSLCEDRHTALYVSSLRQTVSAGPQRDTTKAGMLWVPSRHQMADGLTKDGLGHLIRDFLDQGRCHLHEVSAQELRRQHQQLKSSQEESGVSVDSVTRRDLIHYQSLLNCYNFGDTDAGYWDLGTRCCATTTSSSRSSDMF